MIEGIVGATAELELHSRARQPIPNFQATVLPAGIEVRDAARRREFPDADYRLGPSAYYNCHGLAFAGRRTAIESHEAVTRLLDEDDYRLIQREQVLPGDLVIYYSDGDPEHSAIVVEPPTAENLWIPVVYSKWAAFSEAVHVATRCPYDFAAPRYYRVRR